MRTLLSTIIMPLPFLGLLLVTAALFYLSGKKKTSRAMLISALVWLILISTPLLPWLLVTNLENRYPVFTTLPATEEQKQVHILVLGGGHTNDARLPATGKLSETALARLAEGIRIYRSIPGSTIITSGYKGKEDVPQATVLADAARLLGVPEEQIKSQTLPGNTYMEATEYKRLFGDTTALVVVTSAIHIPRAMYLFQKAGLNPIPAPASHLFKKGTKRKTRSWVPSASYIGKTESAIHEYVGLLWYKLGGETIEKTGNP
jgi:uncharacterized SAM-binding protein YcdF (DUF218 family)